MKVFNVIRNSQPLLRIAKWNKLFSTRLMSEKIPYKKFASNAILPNGINLAATNEEFYALYPTIYNDFKECCTNDFIPVLERFNNVVQYNILNKNYRTCFPVINAYAVLVNNNEATEEKHKLAHVLDWCLELLVTACQLNDDIMDQSKNRWERPCWYLMPNIGMTSLHDTKMLEMITYAIIRKYFSKMPYYKHVLDIFTKTYFLTMVGQSKDFNLSQEYRKNRDLSQLSLRAFCTQYHYKTYYFVCRISVYLGIYLAGRDFSEYYKLIDNLLERMGNLHQTQNDAWDCFGTGKKHEALASDVCHGKATWIIATAQLLANPHQLQLLTEHYGKYDTRSYRIVMQIFNDLDMFGHYQKYKEEEFAKFYEEISAIPDDSLKEVLYQCIDVHDDKDKFHVNLDSKAVSVNE